jgi:hypothetical protein
LTVLQSTVFSATHPQGDLRLPVYINTVTIRLMN